jgi:hypothetical protein
MEKDVLTVTIPAALYKKIQQKIESDEKNAVADYIIKTLEKKLSEDLSGAESLTDEEEEKVKERLKALGYMD